MIELILNVSFMVSGRLGTLESNGMDDVVEHGAATPGILKTIDDELL